ncbi:MAG: hypothetical protein KAV82_00710 [Phycisphaerae bacterium]|nr:hypothetical protein [Phycisphaerae bacterium]
MSRADLGSGVSPNEKTTNHAICLLLFEVAMGSLPLRTQLAVLSRLLSDILLNQMEN